MEFFLHHDSSIKADILDRQFSPAFTADDYSDDIPYIPRTSEIHISESGVKTRADHKPYKGWGPDSSPCRFRK